MSKAKKKAWDECSRYIRLRDALEYCKEVGIDISQFSRVEDIVARCCTCGVVKSWIRGDAGHFIGRGLGGGSGVYFDERNIHFQCKPCNGFRGAKPLEYQECMVDKYGEHTIDVLRIKDKQCFRETMHLQMK